MTEEKPKKVTKFGDFERFQLFQLKTAAVMLLLAAAFNFFARERALELYENYVLLGEQTQQVYNTVVEQEILPSFKHFCETVREKLTEISGREASTAFAFSKTAALDCYVFSPPLTRLDVTSAYGFREDPIDGGTSFHRGTDYAALQGQTVTSICAGRVLWSGDYGSYGTCLLLKHDAQLYSLYAHLSEIYVLPGCFVTAGQAVGAAGSSGRATGPHLHLEIIYCGYRLDPATLLEQYAVV